MMIAKQPNGKYCFVQSFAKITEYNLTEEDIVDKYVQSAKADAEKALKEAKQSGAIIADISPKYYKNEDEIDKILGKIGFERPYRELIKYVPLKPLNQRYIHNDFVTYAQCPNCDMRVANGIGYEDEKCQHCGQMLKW